MLQLLVELPPGAYAPGGRADSKSVPVSLAEAVSMG